VKKFGLEALVRVDMEEERYETLKELGSGNFGVARLAKDKKTGELVAIKYIERGKKVQYAWNFIKHLMIQFFLEKSEFDLSRFLFCFAF